MQAWTKQKIDLVTLAPSGYFGKSDVTCTFGRTLARLVLGFPSTTPSGTWQRGRACHSVLTIQSPPLGDAARETDSHLVGYVLNRALQELQRFEFGLKDLKVASMLSTRELAWNTLAHVCTPPS